MRPYRPPHCAGGKRFVTFPGADARSLHQRRPRDRRVLPRRIRRAAERARCAIRLYCFQFAAKLGVLLVSISFFHREGCLFYEAGGGRGPVGVAVRAQRGSLRRGLCNSPPTFLEDRQDYLQHLGGRRREIRHPPRSFAEQAHNRRAWLKTPPKGATSRRRGATAAQVRRGHRLPLSTRALVAGTTGMARPQALQRQRCQVASPTTGRLLVRLTSLPILALL